MASLLIGEVVMKELKIAREPGFVYDLIFGFIMRFNKDYCLSKFINYQKPNKDTEFFNKIFSDFLDVSEEVLPFFYLKDDGKCFLTEFYYAPYKDIFESDYTFLTLYKKISEINELKRNLIKFYFPNLSEEEINNSYESIECICRHIKNSKYNDSVKSGLYSFFIDSEPVVKILLDQLLSMQVFLKQKYEMYTDDLLMFQSNLNLESVLSRLCEAKRTTGCFDEYNKFLVVPCILCKNCVKCYLCKDRVVLMLGLDYIEYLNYISLEKCVPELDTFGNAIAEKNRVDILDLMLDLDEITIKELEQKLSLTGTNAYYHLNLMIKANVIRARNKGRTVYYSINKPYFAAVIKSLEKYK